MRGTGESGQGTRITFRQEKGSEEGFMAVFEQFRTTWGWVFLLFPPSLLFLPGFHLTHGLEERSMNEQELAEKHGQS
jgi:hypothetical protein